jgi:hypothetical protein
MARKTTIVCDAPGCGAETEMTDKANSLEGWVRRDISDSINKRLAEGMRDYGATRTFYLCPKHLEDAEAMPSPPVHPAVVEFWRQEEPEHG